ncbi:MAG: hypothetical protein BWY79_02062 [Actinobacteria bacterium ADurb.Bin444]|nr:MAG: hypothetical protein BWY79_02062 [Actinobacteria bacterium ADurb.Bin444]
MMSGWPMPTKPASFIASATVCDGAALCASLATWTSESVAGMANMSFGKALRIADGTPDRLDEIPMGLLAWL